MNSNLDVKQMAETLVVLAGDNAWNAARAFGSDYAQVGKPAEARHWRNIAKAVLRKYCDTFARPAELTITPDIQPEALPMASVSMETVTLPDMPFLALPAPAAEAVAEAPVITIEPELVSEAPIPLRARRQLALLPKPEGEAAATVTLGEAAVAPSFEFEFARAA